MYTIDELTINSGGSVTKVDQIIQKLKQDIQTGKLQPDERLPSIVDFRKQRKVAKETVEKAYKELQRQGYIFSVPGKGNYVSPISLTVKKIIMIIDKQSSYTKEIYSAFSKRLGVDVNVDLQIHHNDPILLNEVLLSSRGKYHLYVIFPPSTEIMKEHEFEATLVSIPASQLVILDRKVSLNNFKCINIYQDFNNDIFEAFSSRFELFDIYQGITLIVPETNGHYTNISEGVMKFCSTYIKTLSISSSLEGVNLKRGELYIVLTESHVADFTRKLRDTYLQKGKDIGLLSLHDSILNELLEVSVLTSDFEAMGETAARLVLEKEVSVIRNAYRLIQRKSL